MKLVKKYEGSELYDMENGYLVEKQNCSWLQRGFRYQFHAEFDSYLPGIYDSIDDLENRGKNLEFAFTIQTTSYGALSPEEIHKVISGYQVALDTIKMVEAAFQNEALS